MGNDHDFADSLQFSHDCQDAPWWEVSYRQFFPTFQTMINVRQDGPRQRQGIDRLVILNGGRNIPIDEKARRKAYPDIALETVSDLERGAPGWVRKDLLCEFISYAKIPARRCWLLPTVPLQTAYSKYGREWERRYGTIIAHNLDRRSGRRWRTQSVLVPDDVLFNCLKNVLCASWNDEQPRAPQPRTTAADYTHQIDLFGRVSHDR